MSFDEKFIERNIAELAEEYSKIHGSNINLARITPELVDGLKVVQRRLLYIMYLKDQGKNYRKVAAITGDTIARIHHHGPSSVYAAIVNLAQAWNNNIPLIDGMGNYGSVSGDEAGADRYITARLSEYTQACFFEDWKESAVDMIMGADEETKEPKNLPAKYPNLLLNGLLGIGFGMSSNIPPYCFKEVVEIVISLMKDPNAAFLLIPDSPTGCDIVAGNFPKMCEGGTGAYTMRCKYEIDSDQNIVIIKALPYQVTVNTIRERIADIKEKNGLAELINMQDYSGKEVDLHLHVRHDVNPYKFIKKLIEQIGGLEKSYPVNITVTDDYRSYDWSIRQLLLEWIKYRREQKRVVVNHSRTTILGEQRTNDVKIFIMQGNNLDETVKIFRTSRNRSEIEQRLIEKYKDTSIKMDSLQARTLSDMRMVELTVESYEKCLNRRDELEKELERVNTILSNPSGIDDVITEELRDGVKRFGTERKSSVVPYKISIETEIEGYCILQLSADGNVMRRMCSNVDEEPVPNDINGFAVKVENESSFVAIDEDGYFAFIRAKDLPIDSEVPLNRFIRDNLGKVVALIPFDIDNDYHCTLISKHGILKKFAINEMKPSKKPCIELTKDDKLIKGITSRKITSRDILVYTDQGYGQRLDPNMIRVTSYQAKGIRGFKLPKNDEIIGCYLVDPRKQYLLYVTTRGKARINRTEFLPVREDKHEEMVRLIGLGDRDSLVAIIGVQRTDKLQVFYQDGQDETVDISKISEGTMSSAPEKITKVSSISSRIVKVKIL